MLPVLTTTVPRRHDLAPDPWNGNTFYPARDADRRGAVTGNRRSLSPTERRRLLGDDHVPGDARRHVHELAATLREVAAALVDLDPESSDPDVLRPLVAQASGIVDTLRSQPDHRRHGSVAQAPSPASLLPERSPVSGRTNPVAIPLVYHHEADRTYAEATYSAPHEGPAGGVHGGLVAASFDEILGVAQMNAGVAGYTGELRVRFHRLTPLGRVIRYQAWVAGLEGRKLEMQATSHDGDELVAEAWGTFLVRQTVRLPDLDAGASG
jgi:acyl-coenzyme A thioesterase PaaI-like protein